MRKLLNIYPALERFIGFSAGFIGFSAGFAEVCMFLGVVYGFLFPGQVAKAVVDFEQLMVEARADVGRIAEASDLTAQNTEKIAEDAEKLANAIPLWVKFVGSGPIDFRRAA